MVLDANAFGIEAPRNARIVDLVEGFGRGEGAPSASHLAELGHT